MQVKPYRVVQWATGNIGARSLRHVIDHPDLTLAGLYVHSTDKVGTDAGELCGRGTTGVLATSNVDEIVDLNADCVLYMPATTELDELCRLLASGTINAGTVAAKRITASGMRNGKPLLSFQATWYCTHDVEPEWDLRDTGWRVNVDGDAPLTVDLWFPPIERMAEVSPGYTANRAVNAVPFVCEAAPGIHTTLDLPQIIPTLSNQRP